MITGQRFVSSDNRIIEEQWCYAEPVGSRHPGNLIYRLELARATGDGPLTPYPLTPETLRLFEMTEAQVAELTPTHCRFTDRSPD